MTMYFKKFRSYNNLDQLRFIAASLVIFSHCFPLSLGDNKHEPIYLLTGNTTLGAISVSIFFAISGYLITKSWNNQPKLLIFSWKRFLRICPGLITTIMVSTVVIGPIVSSLSFKDYFLSLNTLNIIKSTSLPGVFTNNIYPSAVNGSLWTLSWEVKLYIMTAFLGMLGMIRNKRLWVVFLFIEIITCNLLHLDEVHYVGYFISKLIIYYLVGVCYFLYEDKLKYNYRLCFLLLGIWIFSFNTRFFEIISYISIPYVIFTYAFTCINPFPKFLGKNDYSYGLYIYAFPIQQAIVYFFKNQITPIELFLIAYPVTFLFAYISWHYIEKNSLKLKDVCFSDFKLYQKIVRGLRGD